MLRHAVTPGLARLASDHKHVHASQTALLAPRVTAPESGCLSNARFSEPARGPTNE